jgi:hypothetical protein
MRQYNDGTLTDSIEPIGFYWSSSVGGIVTRRLNFSSNEIFAEVLSAIRASGGSVRCIKN